MELCLKAFVESLRCLMVITSLICSEAVDLRLIDHPLQRRILASLQAREHHFAQSGIIGGFSDRE